MGFVVSLLQLSLFACYMFHKCFIATGFPCLLVCLFVFLFDCYGFHCLFVHILVCLFIFLFVFYEFHCLLRVLLICLFIFLFAILYVDLYYLFAI